MAGDPLAEFLGDEDVAEALRQWAFARRETVLPPYQKWRASGFTDAVVTTVLLESSHRRGGTSAQQLIIKVIPDGAEETGLHEEAWRQNEDFARRHLVRQPERPWPMADGRSIMFQDIAGDLLDFRPLDGLNPEVQAAGCAAVVRLVLADWNGDTWPDRPRLVPAVTTTYLRQELRKPISRIEEWAVGHGLAEPGAEWVSATPADGADRLPNPIEMVRSGLAAARVEIHYVYGLSHGDLHLGNILVPYREPRPGTPPALPEAGQIRIVDLAAFNPAAPLSRDLVALSLSLAAVEFGAASGPADEETLIRILLDGAREPRTAPEGIGAALRTMQRAAGRPRAFAVQWQAQYLLSLLARALRHTGYRNHSDDARRWFFRVAARAAAEFLQLAETADMIPAESATGETPEQVIVSLVSAAADRAAAEALRYQLAKYAEDRSLTWTVQLDAGLHSPDVVVLLLSERSLVDPGCGAAMEAAASGDVLRVAVRTSDTVQPRGSLRSIRVLDRGESGFAELTHLIGEISLAETVQRQIERKLSRTEAEEKRAHGRQRHRLAIYNRDRRVRLEDERRRATGAGGARTAPTPRELTGETVSAHAVRLVNEAPSVPAAEFRDRVDEKQRVEDAIADEAVRVVVVSGDVGAGKTAFAAELRRRLAAAEAAVEVDAVVYLSADGYRPITVATILADLVRSLPDGADRVRLTERLTDPVEWRDKLTEVLAALRDTAVVVILDAAEHLLDGQGRFRDRELAVLIRELAGRSGHGPTLVVTLTGGPTPGLRRELPPGVRFLALGRGLPFDDAVALLTTLDRAAALGLWDFKERIYSVSQGHPRTLELLVGLLLQEPGRSLSGILDELEAMPRADVVATLFDRTFAQLDRTEQRVVQALAAYGRPVPPAAVDFLLAPSVKDIASEPVLRGLHERRIARLDQGHYFLPAEEGGRVLAGMPPGELTDHRHQRPPFTRFGLWRRAAAYFEHVRPARIDNLLDLRPLFSEIDLRIRGWDWHRAVVLLDFVEDEYLRPWGQSDALVDWRRAVAGRVGDDAEEANNRRRMVAALQQQERIDEALSELRAARRHCPWRHAPRARITLNIQLANVYFDTGQLGRAGRLYRRHIRQCRLVGGMGRELATARANLALCLATTGRHTRALRLFATAQQSARLLPDADRGRILPGLLANNAWVLGEVGEVDAALDLLREGASLGSGSVRENQVGLGFCLNGEAAVLIQSGRAEEAVERAQRAADLGVVTRDPRLVRRANLNLGLAWLCLDRDDEALRTAETSARLDRGPQAVGANGLLGIAAFRQGLTDQAVHAFHIATNVARDQVGRERNDYQAWDTVGLASFGLALIEAEQQSKRLAEAGEAFACARRITGAAGVVNRTTILLECFGERADEELIAAMTAVARGADSPF